MDFVLISYLHYHFKLDYPFVCGDNALFSLALISLIMKAGNSFQFNQANARNDLYKAIVESYLFGLMKNNCLLEIFLEQRRSKSGKIIKPTEILFEFLINTYLQHIDG
jgi:glycerol-3-phosphate O-acyltransferase